MATLPCTQQHTLKRKGKKLQTVSVSYDILDVQLRSTDDDKAKKDQSLKTEEGLGEQSQRTVDG